MAGNVWEWTSDWYEVNQSRVVRGGSWLNDPRYARASHRNWLAPDRRGDFLGFRCAQ
jgi:formylglycine-generating enzyme required for sulfatase activity